MDFKQMAEGLFPCWVLGLSMLYLVKNSKYADTLRVSKEGLWKFAKFLLFITAIRAVSMKFLTSPETAEGIRNTIGMIPWQGMLGVFWEDACNALALTILAKMLSKKEWFKYLYVPLMALMSLSFGSGHMYEGVGAVAMLTFYIPITMRLGKKYGFGTVMLCHMAYDLTTFFTFKIVLGA